MTPASDLDVGAPRAQREHCCRRPVRHFCITMAPRFAISGVMTRDPEWSDWRVFLAVARQGSTLAAGRSLRLSQSTAARRVTALEEALGVKLFERRAHGYRLTQAGDAVLPLA